MVSQKKTYVLKYFLWLLEVPYWFNSSLPSTFWEFCPCQMQKIILCAVRFNLRKVRLNTEN